MGPSIRMTAKGLSPLMMHSYPLQPIEHPPLEKRGIVEQAELSAYRDPETKMLYVPGIAVQRCLIEAAAYSKGKGRATLQKIAAACLLVSPERISTGKREFAVDSRPVVVPATKGRVMRHRPRLDEWEVTFDVEYDDSLLTEKQLRQIVDDAGSRVGLLEFRPSRKGPFGRFMVTFWKAHK